MVETLIRPARPDDAEALADVGRRTFIETFVEGFAIPYPEADLLPYLDESFGPAAVRRRIEEDDSGYWLAERDGRLLAYANAGPNGLPHPDARPGHQELRRIYVDKTAQGLGLGTKLLAISLDWMGAHSTGPLWIGVWSGNLKAQKLYAAHGFETVGGYQFAVGDWLDDEFILRRG